MANQIEVAQLRGLTNDQRLSLQSMTEKVELLQTELDAVTERLETEIENVRQNKVHFEMELSDKERQINNKLDEARGDVAVIWEERLM